MRRERRAEVLEEWLETEQVRRRVVFGANQICRKLAQHVQRFVRQTWTTDDADRITPMLFRNRVETLGDVSNSFIPRCRNQLAAFFVADHRRANACLVIHERMTEASFDTKKLAVDSVHVTIASDDTHQLAAA